MAAISPPRAPDVDRYGPAGRSAWRDVDWGPPQRWAVVAGRPVNYVELGPPDGEPLVFVHGLAGAWVNWLEQLPFFAASGRRVLAVDLPGFGHSPLPAETITIPGYGRLLDEFLDVVGIADDRPIALVGNSMGGFIATEVAIRFSQRVGALVLVSAAGISVEHQRNERVLATLRRFELLISWLATHPDARFALRPRYRALAKLVFAHPRRLAGPLVYEQLNGSGKPGFLPALDACTNHPIRNSLAQIRCPTLVVWGRVDRVVPPRDADVFGELIPGARLLWYEDTGHVPMLERPARFNRDVQAFLDEVLPAAPAAAAASADGSAEADPRDAAGSASR